MSDYNYIGASMPRYEGEGRVTGKTTYVDDINMPGMCYVKVFRSPVHHGIIKSVDPTETLKIPGVLGVLTHADVPGVNCGWFGDCEVFAEKAVRFKGQIICGVVAETEDIAWEGVQKLKVDIEELAAVFEVSEALKPGAPSVRGEGDNYFYWGDKPTFTLKLGDVEAGFKEADFIVESEYTEGGQDHAYMEPHASVAYFDGGERLCIHTVSQCLYFQLRPLCAIFNLPMSKIRYIGGNVGGGFGGKNEIHADHIAGVAAIKFRRPIKFRWTRQEDLAYSTKRGGWRFHYKDGVTKDGRIVARHVEHWKDGGAFVTFSPYGVEKGSLFLCGPYSIPNILIEGHCVFTNKPTSSSMRGYTIMNGQFCADVQVQKIADKLGMDPWEVRMINAFRDGDLGAGHYVIEGAGAIEAVKSTAELAGVDLPAHLLQMSSRGR
jgi:CO/xanthine dehydrogenase Mo-binding subunit